MKNPLVSIIVPVYNVEPFLSKCLDSLIDQKLSTIEIICVNDASVDGSLRILESYAERDPRIRIIDKPINEGLSATRNVGIAAVKGEWSMFVDSDDFVEPELCSNAYECASSKDADLVIYDYSSFSSDSDLHRGSAHDSRLNGLDPHDKAALLSLFAYAWTKFIRTEHLLKLGALFPVGKTYEDQPFHWQVVLGTKKVGLLPKRLYKYRQRAGSIGYRSDWSRADYALVYDDILDFLRSCGLFEEYRPIFIRQRLQRFAVTHDTISPEFRHRIKQLALQRMDREHWQIVHSDRLLDRRTRDFFLYLEGDWMAMLRRRAWMAARAGYRLFRPAPDVAESANDK
ncbi:MAG TPA: glycosyltransferase [Acidobacteriota bacterium]|nr:glycosyltransferase [Acidobacteriota bacterium]